MPATEEELVGVWSDGSGLEPQRNQAQDFSNVWPADARAVCVDELAGAQVRRNCRPWLVSLPPSPTAVHGRRRGW